MIRSTPPSATPILPRVRLLAIVFGSHWLELWTPDGHRVESLLIETVDLDRWRRLAAADLSSRLTAPWRDVLWTGDRCGSLAIRGRTPEDVLEREHDLLLLDTMKRIERKGARHG